MKAWPRVTKYCTYSFCARHDLRGYTIHSDANNPHDHHWVVTLIFRDWETRPDKGFTRDEPEIDASFGARVRQLEGTDLNELMPVPPTAENLAMWLLFDWMPCLTKFEINYELSAVRVSKCDKYAAEVDMREAKRWREFVYGLEDAE
jgi:6-pyruvoyl-tetrahydropterin synthase